MGTKHWHEYHQKPDGTTEELCCERVEYDNGWVEETKWRMDGTIFSHGGWWESKKKDP